MIWYDIHICAYMCGCIYVCIIESFPIVKWGPSLQNWGWEGRSLFHSVSPSVCYVVSKYHLKSFITVIQPGAGDETASGTNSKLCPDSFSFPLYWLYVRRLRRISHPLVSSALIPVHFRRLTWNSQNNVTINVIQFFFPYLLGVRRKAGRGKSRAYLQVNLLVSRHHAGCNGTIDNRTCPSSTGNLQTSCRKRPRHAAAKTESVLGRSV